MYGIIGYIDDVRMVSVGIVGRDFSRSLFFIVRRLWLLVVYGVSRYIIVRFFVLCCSRLRSCVFWGFMWLWLFCLFGFFVYGGFRIF